MTLALGIGWCIIALAVMVYLGGRGFMHPLLSGIFWPITTMAFLLAAVSRPGSGLRRVMGLDSGLRPVEPPGADADLAGERVRYGQINTAERER